MEPELATGYIKVWINLLLLLDSYCYDHVDKEMIDRTDIHEKGEDDASETDRVGHILNVGNSTHQKPEGTQHSEPTTGATRCFPIGAVSDSDIAEMGDVQSYATLKDGHQINQELDA